jgi:hypothetical protein
VPLLAGEREVMDVEHREVGPPRLEQGERVRGGARLADGQGHALGLVVAAARRRVDAGVHRVRREVEQQRRVGVRPVAARRPAAPREQRGQEQQDEGGAAARHWDRG